MLTTDSMRAEAPSEEPAAPAPAPAADPLRGLRFDPTKPYEPADYDLIMAQPRKRVRVEEPTWVQVNGVAFIIQPVEDDEDDVLVPQVVAEVLHNAKVQNRQANQKVNYWVEKLNTPFDKIPER